MASPTFIPGYGADLVTNISGSQFRLNQRETELRRSHVTSRSADVPSVTIPTTFPPGKILGEYLFSTTSLRNRLFGTNNTRSINSSLLVNQERVNINNSSTREGMNSQDFDVRQGTNDNNVDGKVAKDGRIHSLRRQKHGPYTCPRSNQKFQTSQQFAAHVHSHYRHETADQWRKRIETRISKKSKNLQIYDSREGLTILADPSKSKAESLVQPRAGSIKVQVLGDVQGHDPDVPPGFEGYHYGSSSGVTIKAEHGQK